MRSAPRSGRAGRGAARALGRGAARARGIAARARGIAARARGIAARARGIAAVAALFACAACAACPATGEVGPAPPPAPPEPGAARVRHAVLAEVETAVARALASLDAPRFDLASAGAGAIHAGAERILGDRPATVEGSDRTQYEGLIVQLEERALELQAAAREGSAVLAERARVRVSATCMRCHQLFRAR